MKKRPEIFLAHMLKAILQIEEYIKPFKHDSFVKDNKTIDAVIRQFEILGEAAGRVIKDLTKNSPIAWEEITGMRHRLIHDYMGVDVDIVWETATNGIKPLKTWLKKTLVNYRA